MPAILSPVRTQGGHPLRGQPAAADLRRVRRPGHDQGQPQDLHRGREEEGRAPRPRPPLRAAGTGQDEPGLPHRQGDGRRHQADGRAGHRADGRPLGHPDQPPDEGGPVHRRDPPAPPLGRGDPLLGHGGLQPGHRHRPGPERPKPQAQDQEVHPHRRDDPGRTDHGPAPGAVRHHPPPGLLQGRGPQEGHPEVGGPAQGQDRRRRRRARSP